MPFKYPIELVYNAVKTLIDIRKPINVDEARDDCLMDVHLSYTGGELPSLTPTPQATAEAIEEWNNVRISNEDYNNQEKTNRLFSLGITLIVQIKRKYTMHAKAIGEKKEAQKQPHTTVIQLSLTEHYYLYQVQQRMYQSIQVILQMSYWMRQERRYLPLVNGMHSLHSLPYVSLWSF